MRECINKPCLDIYLQKVKKLNQVEIICFWGGESQIHFSASVSAAPCLVLASVNPIHRCQIPHTSKTNQAA